MTSNQYFIDNQEQLDKFCKLIKNCKIIAIDTEFARVSTYFPIPCILQIATSNGMAAIDLTKKLDITEIEKIISRKSAMLIIHAFRQDLEVFKQIFKASYLNFFDTQIAEMFLGTDEPPSYGKLVEKYFNITLEKSQQFSDWAKRPLNKKQLEYAFLDVKYLLEIYEKQRAVLKKEKKLKYFEAEIAEQLANFEDDNDPIDPARFMPYADCPEKLFIANFLNKRRLLQAKEKNKPKNRILKDKNIIELLNSMKKGDLEIQETISKIEETTDMCFDDDFSKYYASQKKLIRQYRKIDKNKVQALQKLLTDISSDQQISKQLIAARSDLVRLIVEPEKSKLLKGWRKELFGSKALECLE